MSTEIGVYEEDHAVGFRETEGHDANTYNMFRAKFADVFENNAALTSTVARIEVTISTAQERLYRQMEEMAKSLKEIAIVSNDLQRLQVQMDKENQELVEVRAKEDELSYLLIGISQKVDKLNADYTESKPITLTEIIVVGLNFVLMTLFIIHMMMK